MVRTIKKQELLITDWGIKALIKYYGSDFNNIDVIFKQIANMRDVKCYNTGRPDYCWAIRLENDEYIKFREKKGKFKISSVEKCVCKTEGFIIINRFLPKFDYSGLDYILRNCDNVPTQSLKKLASMYS